MTGQPNNRDLGDTHWQRIAAGYGLGHDDRARESEPVAARLRERFYPWQLEGTVEESWEECRRHAENLRRIRSIGAPSTVGPANPHEASPGVTAHRDLLGERIETSLFGEDLAAYKRKRR